MEQPKYHQYSWPKFWVWKRTINQSSQRNPNSQNQNFCVTKIPIHAYYITAHFCKISHNFIFRKRSKKNICCVILPNKPISVSWSMGIHLLTNKFVKAGKMRSPVIKALWQTSLGPIKSAPTETEAQKLKKYTL